MNSKNNEKDFFISDENGENWARLRACGIIIKDNKVLMITNDSCDFYYSVGGGVHIGESTEDACRREVFEETGVYFQIDRLLFIHENFFTGEDHDCCHEIAFYYLMKSNFEYELKCESKGITGVNEKLEWIPIARYHEFKAYPNFFGTKLMKLPINIEHIITIEANNR